MLGPQRMPFAFRCVFRETFDSLAAVQAQGEAIKEP